MLSDHEGQELPKDQEFEMLKSVHKKLIKAYLECCYKLDDLNSYKAASVKLIIQELLIKELNAGPFVEVKKPSLTKAELIDCISEFSKALVKHKKLFTGMNDPQVNKFIKRALVILATVVASIPTLGVVALCMAAYGHFVKKNPNHFWKSPTTTTKTFVKDSEKQLKLVSKSIKKK